MRAKWYFRWYDLWMGVYIDRDEPAVYLGLLPCVGVKVYRP